MASVEVCGINIQYDDTVDDIDRIVKIIKLNAFLFKAFEGKTLILDKSKSTCDGGIIYISDFDNFFDEILKIILNDENISSLLNDSQLLCDLHNFYLSNKARQDGTEPNYFFSCKNITDDRFCFFLALKYFNYKTHFKELSDFLKSREGLENILDWLNETQRYDTYNSFLHLFINQLKFIDPFFLNRINKTALKNIDSLISNFKVERYDIPKFYPFFLDDLFLGFLDSIKAPKHWKELYYKLKKENGIIFEKSNDDSDYSSCFKGVDGVWKIKVMMDGTIISFITFVHEFMHYVCYSRGGVDPLLLFREIPSIYYERVAAQYLVNIGYDKNVIKQGIYKRKKNNFIISLSLYDILLDIYKANNGQYITRDDRIISLERYLEMLNDIERKTIEWSGRNIDSSSSNKNYNYGEMADEECDIMLMNFVKNGTSALDGYEYLTATYFVDSLLEKETSDDILKKMEYVTEYLPSFLSTDEIINYLGIQNTSEKSKKMEKKSLFF